MKNCPECNSEKIIRDAITFDNDGSQLRIAVEGQPNALILKKRSYSNAKVHVCGECGFVKFFVDDPKLLWTAYQNRGNNI